MKNKKLLITLLFSLIICSSSCTTEGGKNSSSKNTNINSSNIVTNNSSSILSNNTSSSSIVELPSDALNFVNAVNLIVLNQDAGYYINNAYDLYESLEDWDYEEVLEAFEKLNLLEQLYNNYLKQNNAVESFINHVDDIPYDLDISDERAIVLAEEAYKKLTDVQKEMLGVSQSYERLVAARTAFDILYEQAIENAKNEAAKAFTDLVDKIPEKELITLDNGQAIENAINHYESLSDEIKKMEDVINAYDKLINAQNRYNELVENPSLNDEILAALFINAVSKLPLKENVSLADRIAIFDANDLYKKLPATTKLLPNVATCYTKVLEALKTYYDLYLNSQGLQREDNKIDEVVIINNAEDLLAIENNLSGSYKLGSDIDLDGIEWEALGEKNTNLFSGVLDGAGHTIYNMSNSNSNDARFGLFAHIGNTGVVKNLVLEGSVKESGSWAGAICIDNNGTISNCLINLDIQSPSGGHIGGIACNNNAGAKTENCVVISKISGGSWDGGLFVGNYGTINNCFTLVANVSNKQVIGNNSNQNLECAKTENELKKADLYKNFDKSIWCVIDGYYPTLVQ